MYQQWNMLIFKIGWQSIYQKQDIAERYERIYKKYSIFTFNIAIVEILLKLIYKFKVISIEIPSGLFSEIDNLHLEFMLKCKGLKIAKSVWKRTKLEDLYFQFQKLL